MKIVMLDRTSLDRGDLDDGHLQQIASQLICHDATAPEQISQRIANSEVVITNKVKLNAHAIAQAKQLKLICIAATGTNNVDLAAARDAGVTVCNVPDYCTDSVAEHTYGLMLQWVRNLPAYHQDVRNGTWSDAEHFCLLEHPISELAGKILGIVGYGSIGRRVAELAQALHMQVLIAERPGITELRPGRTAFMDVLRQAEILTLHCPLTPETHHLLNRQHLDAMKPGALLVNTARGALIDEQALLASLNDGHLGGAALDVLEQEPPPAGYPMLQYVKPNLLLTPHIAWASRRARQQLLDELVENIRHFSAGQARNVVN